MSNKTLNRQRNINRSFIFMYLYVPIYMNEHENVVNFRFENFHKHTLLYVQQLVN